VKSLTSRYSGTVMRMPKTCHWARSPVSSKRCSTGAVSSPTMSITSLVALKKTVCQSSSASAFRPLIFRLGTGAVYSFDPVGSYEREACRAAGAAQSLVQPFLDNQVCSVLCGPSLIARLVVRFLTDLRPALDLLQEPAGGRGPITSTTLALIGRACYRH
jgi:hypothetical protein